MKSHKKKFFWRHLAKCPEHIDTHTKMCGGRRPLFILSWRNCDVIRPARLVQIALTSPPHTGGMFISLCLSLLMKRDQSELLRRQLLLHSN